MSSSSTTFRPRRFAPAAAAAAAAAVLAAGCLTEPVTAGAVAAAGSDSQLDQISDDLDRVRTAIDAVAGVPIPAPTGCPDDQFQLDAVVAQLEGDTPAQVRQQLRTAQQLLFDELTDAAARC